ncbi:Bifunctional DNA-directed RNA polymerase subunit beta-beta' [Gossypium australe]|uniref:Bifunctional DNA-directed RNA polymerase subunit beta-beta n=1 Tax=Gossypium australe TaxID=47621 RepID=A0A5B6VQ28_9ROSI|nr:Bifunctional DNA-directed RNA polymerase subunit beta-beta' [Gossypium australe]
MHQLWAVVGCTVGWFCSLKKKILPPKAFACSSSSGIWKKQVSLRSVESSCENVSQPTTPSS